MVGFIKRLFKQPQAPGFSVSSGSQQIVDPLLVLNAQKFYAGLRREDKLKLYYGIYHSQPLAVGAVNTLVKMCNSRPLFKSGNPEVDARAKAIWSEIKGHEVNAQLMRQGLIYGYSVGEWVSESMQRVDRVCVPDSPLVRFVPSKYGVIEAVQQLAGSLQNPLSASAKIPADKFVVYRRDPESTFDYYGSSIFESAVEQLESLCRILRAQISVYMRLGKPRFHVSIPMEGLTPEQAKERVNQTKAVLGDLGSDLATDIYTPTGCDIKIIGAESFGQKFSDETSLVIQNILAAVGLPPALLHVVTNSGGTESWLRQSVIVLQSILDNVQDSIATSWNASFWKVVQVLEGLPVLPVMEFEAPRLLEMLAEEQARTAKRQNDEWEWMTGFRPREWMAAQLGCDDVDDPSAADAYIERQRTQPQQNQNNPFGGKSNTTKATDEKGTNNAGM